MDPNAATNLIEKYILPPFWRSNLTVRPPFDTNGVTLGWPLKIPDQVL